MTLHNFGAIVFVTFVFVVYIWFKWVTSPERAQQQVIKKASEMNAEDRSNYLFGPINDMLICPHCQTKGRVHVKQMSKIVTSIGKVGGVLKTDTTSSTTTIATQHHCDQCTSTWEI